MKMEKIDENGENWLNNGENWSKFEKIAQNCENRLPRLVQISGNKYPESQIPRRKPKNPDLVKKNLALVTLFFANYNIISMVRRGHLKSLVRNIALLVYSWFSKCRIVHFGSTSKRKTYSESENKSDDNLIYSHSEK